LVCEIERIRVTPEAFAIFPSANYDVKTLSHGITWPAYFVMGQWFW